MEIEGSKGLKVNLGKTKVVVSGPEGEVTVSKVDPCGICGKQVIANSVLYVKCRKMSESKEGDPEVGERFRVWMMQEASSWIYQFSGGVV